MHLRNLWEAREEIAEILAEIFASSLAIDEFLEGWRVAGMALLLQKADKDKPGNDRPESPSSVVRMVLEEIGRHNLN